MTSIPTSLKAFSLGKDTSECMKLDYPRIFWLFMLGSVFGFVLETVYHFIAFGGYESRAGLVWGPFSPIYGAGVVVVTLLLNRLHKAPLLMVFLVSMIAGSLIEYFTSWWLETFFGAVAWNYDGTFGSINGRINFMFAFIWGCLGLAWVKVIMPFLKRLFAGFDWKSPTLKIMTVVLSIFMVLNVVVTIQAFNRESARVAGVPPQTALEQFVDEQFPSEFMQTQFHMTIYGNESLIPRS